MPVIKSLDIFAGEQALHRWAQSAFDEVSTTVSDEELLRICPELPSREMAMAVRYALYVLEIRAPGKSVEIRVAPWGAVKILEGPQSDPHNLTPPDVIEFDPDVWLRLACGVTTWDQEKEAGHITAVGQREDVQALLPLPL